MPSAAKPSQTSIQSPPYPAQSRQASTSSPRLHNQGCNPTTPISDYPSDHGLRSVSSSNIIVVIRDECLRVGAARLGFFPEDIGTHSFRSSRAMAMHLANVPNRTLVAIVRCRSLGFMVYIQQQISSFSTGFTVKVTQQTWFWHF